MTGKVIDFPIIARPVPQIKPRSKKSARISLLEDLIAKFNGKPVTHQVEIAAIMDIKMRTAAQMGHGTPEDFIWCCIVQGLADIEHMSAEDFIRKYLSDSGDRTASPTAKRLPELNL